MNSSEMRAQLALRLPLDAEQLLGAHEGHRERRRMRAVDGGVSARRGLRTALKHRHRRSPGS
jgi:hypothetical protein